MKLQAAEAIDISTVLSWIADEQSLRMWAGPAVRYPSSIESLWSDVGASEDNAYILVDVERAVIGFGQILLRENNSIHLARLIVNPALRGQGIGRNLCEALMDMGVSKHQPEYLTLNVYESNIAAVGLYKSLGFAVKTSEDSDLVAMIKPLTSAGKGCV